jgi:pimeloyl-ACP methyl ester carboxylesterase
VTVAVAVAVALAVSVPAAAAAQWTERVTVRNAAYSIPGAPSAVVHAPAGFDPAQPFDLVVFLHGWTGCARVLAESGRVACREGEPQRDGWGLAARHDQAGQAQSLFVVPQLAWWTRHGRPGRFARRGVFRAFVEEILGTALAPRLGGARTLASVRSIVLVAHSAGFQTTLAILRAGGVSEKVRGVVLFDALYAGPREFATWVLGAPDRKLISIHTEQRTIVRNHTTLTALARGERRVVVIRSTVGHSAIPAHYLPEILRTIRE